MEDKENIEIDKKEFHKQYVEDIKKNQGFVEVNILVSTESNMCIPTFEIKDAGLEEVAKMISTLEELTRDICKRYPEANCMQIYLLNRRVIVLKNCKYLSKGFNNKLKCKYNKRHIISLDECKNCPNFILMRNKPIRKVSSKRKIVSKETYNKVYERDKGRCRLCGNNNIHLHHIVYRSEDKSLIDEPTNCIMLCYKCHKLCHSNKKKYQPMLINIIKKGE